MVIVRNNQHYSNIAILAIKSSKLTTLCIISTNMFSIPSTKVVYNTYTNQTNTLFISVALDKYNYYI